MPYVAAGFDKISPNAALTDTVITSGLANCIAVAAIDTARSRMRIAHYNTLFCLIKNGQDATQDHVYTCFEKLKRQIGTGLIYRVGLGSVWYNAADKGHKLDGWRHYLCMAALNIFEHEPRIAGTTLSCRKIGEDYLFESHGNSAHMPGGWANSGTDIDYSS